MCFVDYERLRQKFDSEMMTESIRRLEEFDAYQYLISGSIASSIGVKELCKKCPRQYLNWTKVCDGGLLFDTVLLSTVAYIEGADLELDTFEDYNSDQVRKDLGLPDGYFVIAIRSYGDPICINSADGNDEKIYLWDTEEQAFTDIWHTFEDWLAEEIDDGIALIADEALDPLPIKEDGDPNE